MALTMSGAVELPASPERVWERLNDPATLKACITGCEGFERTGADAFAAVVLAKVGPVKARFRGKVRLADLDPPRALRIEGEGEGGVAGFAKGGARVTIEATEGGSRLSYEVEATIGGKLAQVGGRLVNGVARKMADEFFAAFAEAVGEGGESVPAVAEGASAP